VDVSITLPPPSPSSPSDHLSGPSAQRSPTISGDDDDNEIEDDGTLDLDETLASDYESEAESEENADGHAGDANDNEHGRFLSTEEVANLQSKAWGNVHVEAYPRPHVAAVHSHGIPTTKELENMLGGPSANPFAPFNNQTDWELAKWAKLRGPSSTSFTELMGVTGVCLVLPLHIHCSLMT
jgi:hypothetical protein